MIIFDTPMPRNLDSRRESYKQSIVNNLASRGYSTIEIENTFKILDSNSVDDIVFLSNLTDKFNIAYLIHGYLPKHIGRKVFLEMYAVS